MKQMISLFLFALVVLVSSLVSAQGNLPKSKEAKFAETYSQTEVQVFAKGIGKDVDEAEKDAKKAAIYYLLYSANDPILQTAAEKEAFNGVADKFFEIGNINNYVTYMANDIKSKVNTKEGVKVEKLIRVGREKLREDLQSQGILVSKEALSQAAGNPFLMVIPEVKKGENPIQKLQNEPLTKKAAETIEGFLTARKYDVQVPEAMDNLNDLINAQAGAKGVEDDIAYQLALSIGSDVYITFNAAIENKKGIVAARAYETTTGRLLGTETGYSSDATAPDAALVEAAMNFAADKVLSRINAYWKEDIKNGQQFKVIFKITAQLDDDAMEDLSDEIDAAIKESSNGKFKKGASGDKTKDVVIWSNKYKDGDELYKYFRDRFKKHDSIKVKKINVNRKLVIMELTSK